MRDAPDRIGRYEIIEPLPGGGMGQVYKARDPELRREVALKILREDGTVDPSRQRRLLEEAQAASGLNHPNIIAVYDVGVDDGRVFIVSEFIRGHDLSVEIERGVLPLKRLLALAVQTAAGLRAAHDAGIAHRDLKPKNVMVTHDGRIKIIDFGLAKVMEGVTEVAGHDAVTVTLPGTVAGTPQYMSPEQARGGNIDFRTDQFSFGLMLYEMATGTHPFRRESHPQTMTAIISDEARPIGELNSKIPTMLRWIIERCLAKDPGDRYASTADLHKDLATLHGRYGEITSDDNRVVVAPPSARRWLTIALGALAAVATVVVTTLALAPAPSTFSGHFSPIVTDGGFQGSPAWSMDGKALAYVSSVDGVLQIFTRSISSTQPLQITHAGFNSSNPFWAPDNSRIYYHSQAEAHEGLWSISAAGGSPQLVVPNASNATISPDGGTFAFFREGSDVKSEFDLRRGIWMVSANGGEPRKYIEAPFHDSSFVDGMMRFSPDGTKILVWAWGWYSATNHIPASRFWVIPWPTGKPYQVLQSLTNEAPAAVTFDWLPDSRHIIVSLWDPKTTGQHLWKADLDTDTSIPVTSTVGSENWPSLTPDGRRMAFASEAIDFDLVDIPLDGSAPKKMLATSRNELEPSFNRDGNHFVYVSDKNGVLRVWSRIRSDATLDTVVVSPDQFPQGDSTLALGALSISPDGERVAYQRYSEAGYQIWISTVRAAGPPVLLTSGLFYQDGPTWSPDGGSIAFIMRNQQYFSGMGTVRVGSGAAPTVLLANVAALGLRPQWSPDGRWIVCDTDEGAVIVSPDGKQKRVISEEFWLASAWAADSKHVYVLREADKLRHYALTSIDIDTLAERVINPDLGPIPHASQPIRGLTLSGPGTLTTSIATARSDIWVMDNSAPPRGILDRLLPWK
ncbi:MAG TPA: protein kinase [Vicinamibacterales bacterium]|nr:protein kinase [Vicinamibacterales bacterium]